MDFTIEHAGRLTQQSLDKEISAIERFDVWNRRKDFRKFHIEQAMRFRNAMRDLEALGAFEIARVRTVGRGDHGVRPLQDHRGVAERGGLASPVELRHLAGEVREGAGELARLGKPP